jgi:hypothetical protein
MKGVVLREITAQYASMAKTPQRAGSVSDGAGSADVPFPAERACCGLFPDATILNRSFRKAGCEKPQPRIDTNEHESEEVPPRPISSVTGTETGSVIDPILCL